MLLVVGLGNPGPEHAGDRHNAGFLVVDALREAWGLPAYASRFGGLFARGEVGGRPVALLEPQTYMNLSGESVQPAAAFLEVAPQDVLVVHDELDLPWRELRLKVGGGHAGHNGVRSVIDRLGTPDFTRLRVGIGKATAATPATPATPATRATGATRAWVLSGFDPAEQADLRALLDRAVAAVAQVLADGLPAATKALHTKS